MKYPTTYLYRYYENKQLVRTVPENGTPGKIYELLGITEQQWLLQSESEMEASLTKLKNEIGMCPGYDTLKITCRITWGNFKQQTPSQANDFIPITTAQQLSNIMAIPNPQNQPYVLMNDIDLADWDIGDGKGWKAINNFTGNFYGQGHTIKNLTVNDTSVYYVGLFGLFYGEIYDVCLENVNLYGAHNAQIGGLVARMQRSSASQPLPLVINCRVKGGNISNNQTLETSAGQGGLVGYNGGAVKYCSASNITLNGKITMGALCGRMLSLLDYDATIEDCKGHGTLDIKQWGGIICGNVGAYTSMNRCIASGDITCDQDAGLAGYTHLTTNGNSIKLSNIVATQGSVISYSGNFSLLGRVSGSRLSSTQPQLSNIYSGNVNVVREAVSNRNGRDGETITDEQLKSQAFYEGLGFDFDGTTQPDGKPVWSMGTDGYPQIARPYKTFAVNTGDKEYATEMLHETLINNEVKESKTYNVTDKINDTHNQITLEAYLLMSEAAVTDRCAALAQSVACPDYVQTNEPVNTVSQ